MATGLGGMSFVDSYNTTISVLKNYPTINFTISVPDDNRGKEFINQFRADNLSEKEFSSVFKVRIQEVLNREYTIGLEQDLSLSLGNKKYTFDLADLNNLSFVEFKTQKSAIDRANLRKDINSLVSRLSQISPNKKSPLIIVINGSLTDNDRAFYNTNLRLLKNERVIIYDKADIDNLLNKHNSKNNEPQKNSDLETVYDEQFKTQQFIRDVLNKAYNLNLVTEETSSYNDININLNFSDEESKSYLKLLDKDDIINEYKKRNITYDNIISKIVFDITTDIGVLNTNNSLKKYFAFFDDTFDYHDIEFIKEKLSDYDTDILQILTMSDVTLLAEKNSIKLIDYFNVEISPNTSVEESSKIDNFNDKIPFHLDQVVDEDKLGREPVAKAFVDLLKKDIFTDKLNHSFMVHLQGKWGSGKSSFLNFIQQNLNSDIEKWIIVDYNAWQNQHINPPWWSLINQVYLQSKEQFYLIGIRKSLNLWRKEVFRRIWRYSGWQKILALVFFILFILCIIYFGNDILDLFNTSKAADSDNEFLSQLGDFGKLVITFISLLTSIYGFAKFITFPFFVNSSKDAKSFVLKASDPMNQVKRHFNDLVDDINSLEKKQQLAIFIDDIDRCDRENIVCLLEGIQTLFKEKRVLYVIAGDKDWISTSFANTYEEFAINNDKKQLGEQFIQKAFQLSFRLPNISEESKQNYWNHILGLKKEQDQKKIESIDELSEAEQTELKSVLKESKSQLTNPEFVKDFQEKFNLSGDTASNIVIEEKNKDTEELRHLLQEYHKYIDTNPRSIIRLANNYTMARTILMVERVSFNEHILFRWLVIEDLCPKVISIIPTTDKIANFEEVINQNDDAFKRNNCIILLKGQEEFMQREITIEDIKTIKGL